MTRRHYQLFALAILIGAPLLVSLLNHMLVGLGPIAPQQAAAPAAPDYMAPAVNPEDDLPPELKAPPSGQAAQNGPQAGMASDPGAGLNPAGMAVAGSDPSVIDPTLSGVTPSLDTSPAMVLPGDEGGTGGAPAPGSEEALILASQKH